MNCERRGQEMIRAKQKARPRNGSRDRLLKFSIERLALAVEK
jgi:hypothetical protein